MTFLLLVTETLATLQVIGASVSVSVCSITCPVQLPFCVDDVDDHCSAALLATPVICFVLAAALTCFVMMLYHAFHVMRSVQHPLHASH